MRKCKDETNEENKECVVSPVMLPSSYFILPVCPLLIITLAISLVLAPCHFASHLLNTITVKYKQFTYLCVLSYRAILLFSDGCSEL